MSGGRLRGVRRSTVGPVRTPSHLNGRKAASSGASRALCAGRLHLIKHESSLAMQLLQRVRLIEDMLQSFYDCRLGSSIQCRLGEVLEERLFALVRQSAERASRSHVKKSGVRPWTNNMCLPDLRKLAVRYTRSRAGQGRAKLCILRALCTRTLVAHFTCTRSKGCERASS